MKLNRFVSFEGIDFAGKSTQIELLKKRLENLGEQVYVLREPGGTEISERIRDILLDRRHAEMMPSSDLLLYSAARHQLVKQKILPLLEQGAFVLADRYVDSTTAYQGYGRGIEPDTITVINDLATGGLMPELTILLDLLPEEIVRRKALRNAESDRMEQSGLNFYKKIRTGYHKIAENNSRRFKIMDASKSITEIEGEIWKLILEKFEYLKSRKAVK